MRDRAWGEFSLWDVVCMLGTYFRGLRRFGSFQNASCYDNIEVGILEKSKIYSNIKKRKRSRNPSASRSLNHLIMILASI